MNHSGLLYIFACIVCTVVGQLLMKNGTLQVSANHPPSFGILAFLIKSFVNPWVLLGLCSALAAAAAWTLVLGHCQLSFAYPFMGLAIVLVLALSGVLFHEQAPPTRWVGAVIVCIGLYVASRG